MRSRIFLTLAFLHLQWKDFQEANEEGVRARQKSFAKFQQSALSLNFSGFLRNAKMTYLVIFLENTI